MMNKQAGATCAGVNPQRSHWGAKERQKVAENFVTKIKYVPIFLYERHHLNKKNYAPENSVWPMRIVCIGESIKIFV